MPGVQRPRRNRVTPFGTLERSSAKGAIMGNRGDLHDRDGEIVRAFKGPRWIACTTAETNGRHATFDCPGSSAPLFALDEATMLAAGHRPCAKCRGEALARFQRAWSQAYAVASGRALAGSALDDVLHAARLDGDGRQRTHRARVADLPAGTFVTLPAPDDPDRRAAWLMWDGAMRPWSHDGYGHPAPIRSVEVDVLTPEPIVSALRAGYVPEVHLGS